MNLKEYICSVLNKDFRQFGRVTSSCFPAHEFSDDEAIKLKELCEDIHKNGYETVQHRMMDEDYLSTLNTASEYGVFVDPKIGHSYLGVFIIAQLLTVPFVSSTYVEPMLNSNVYMASDSMIQDKAKLLFFLATFAECKPNAVEYQDYLSRSIEDLRRLNVQALSLEGLGW